jgi:hypothetical protein
MKKIHNGADHFYEIHLNKDSVIIKFLKNSAVLILLIFIFGIITAQANACSHKSSNNSGGHTDLAQKESGGHGSNEHNRYQGPAMESHENPAGTHTAPMAFSDDADDTNHLTEPLRETYDPNKDQIPMSDSF